MEAKDKIIKSKVRLQKKNPFFAYLIMNMNISEKDKGVKTIGVNKYGDCVYNKKFIEKLNEAEVDGVFSHEVLHIVLQHLSRIKKYNFKLWNVATDLVVNNILVNCGMTLPSGLNPYNNCFRLGSDIFIKDLDKKSAEEVYKELKDLIGEDKQEGLSEQRFDEHNDDGEGDGLSKAEAEALEKWKKNLIEASVYAQQQENIPQGLSKIVEAILNQKVNWKHLLYKYLTRTLPYDYTYNRPSKKSFSSGFYMPSILRESIEIIISVDTSGSIREEELSEFLGEIINISRSFNNIKMKLIICDCEIKEVYDFGNNDIDKIKNLKLSGGGGTSHKPVYDYVNKYHPNAKMLINFTDGYTDFPNNETIKTIWVITKNGTEKNIPFGEVIKLD